MNSKKIIWVLLDDRQGNTNQSLGVAEALGEPFEVKTIAFSKFIKLPNFLINGTALAISKNSMKQLVAPWPDIVISTARRLSVVQTYIKAQNPAAFLVQIQWPGGPSKAFDIIAVPKHDNISEAANIFYTIGAPHRVTAEIIKKEAALWEPKLQALPSPRVALLLGGSGRKEFTRSHAETLAKLASQLVNNFNGSLLVTTSRRTSSEMVAAIEENLSCPHYIYKWPKDDTNIKDNPYYGFLGLADYIIATGDSMSMCTEAASTGKPVFIYSSEDFIAKKYRILHDILYQNNLAQPLNENSSSNFLPKKIKLDDTAAIAAEIKRRVNF